MKKVDRWLLPDGIEEMLPNEASQVESLRRRLVDLFKCWGYDYVIPPMLEFTDSLLTGAGEDTSLLTFKLTDQVSGKTLGLRADITPQVARMDAHSLKRDGVNRLCYAGHVAHTLPKEPLSSRTPIQAGVELFGESGISADLEVLSLLISTLGTAGLPKQYLDLGHVGVYRSLSQAVGLSTAQETALFELMQAKAMTEIDAWLEREVTNNTHLTWLKQLPRFSGGSDVLDAAAEFYQEAPDTVLKAINDLRYLSEKLCARFPSAQLYFDLSELRGYHYLTGVVFGAFAPGAGTAVASGGRYDHVGEAFGRSRPATGFAVDLSAVRKLLKSEAGSSGSGVFAPFSENEGEDEALWAEVQKLRAAGERVVLGASGQAEPQKYQHCDRLLQKGDAGYTVISL